MNRYLSPRRNSITGPTKARDGAACRTACRATAEPVERRVLFTALVVNTPLDTVNMPGGPVVSLRDAISAANRSATPTTITFDAKVFATNKTITLDPATVGLEVSAARPVTITGPAAGVTIDESDRFFTIDAGATANVSRVTITKGFLGIDNQGTLNLSNSTVSDSGGSGVPSIVTAGATGVIRPDLMTGSFPSVANSGSMTLANVKITGGHGLDNSGTLVMTDSSVTGTDTLGAVANTGTATLNRVTLSGNSAGGFFTGPFGIDFISGGGINNRGSMRVFDSTIADNTSAQSGGGVFNADGTLTLVNCTVARNTATIALGGGFADVPSPGTGGGLQVDGGTVNLANCIVASNGAQGGSPDARGLVHSLGHNLVGKTDGSSGWNAADRTGTAAHPLDARLGPLGSFGGPSQTLSLLPGSPAIDAGSGALALGPNGRSLATDQRGLPRVSAYAVDIGAFEVQVAPRVLGFGLLDAMTGKNLGALTDGQTISLSKSGTRHLDVRALADAGTGSVTFSLNGRYAGTDSTSPFTLLGAQNQPPSGGLAPGSYTLIVQPFSSTFARGAAGAFKAIHFKVIA